MKNTNIFDACREGNLELVKKLLLEHDLDLNGFNEFGFTALQCAAMGSDGADSKITLAIIKLLIEAGADIQIESKDKRTALYLLAEFSQAIAPVQYLIDQGAKTDIYDAHGNHITKNAWATEVKHLLMERTGVNLIKEPELEPIKMDSKRWKLVKKTIAQVFLELENKGLIAILSAGNTQDDGFLACSEAYREHSNPKTISGFCFYTKQDAKRAQKTSMILLGYGGTDGKDKSTEKVGQLIVEAFEQANFVVKWNGKASDRPSIYLHK